jgi:hypothetical protein
MLSFPVFANLQPRTDLYSPDARRFTLFVVLIHPLSFQGFPHSLAQWTAPISFSFNRFRTLSIAMGGRGACPSENLNHYFNFNLFANSPLISRQSSNSWPFCFNTLRTPTIACPPVHQIFSAPLFSYDYKLPIFYPLCFDIHPCNGGCTPLLHKMVYAACSGRVELTALPAATGAIMRKKRKTNYL